MITWLAAGGGTKNCAQGPQGPRCWGCARDMSQYRHSLHVPFPSRFQHREARFRLKGATGLLQGCLSWRSCRPANRPSQEGGVAVTGQVHRTPYRNFPAEGCCILEKFACSNACCCSCFSLGVGRRARYMSTGTGYCQPELSLRASNVYVGASLRIGMNYAATHVP